MTLFFLLPIFVHAAERSALLELRPFCTSEQNHDETILGPIPDVEGYVTLGDDTCPSFIVEDPETLRTTPLEVGDTLDVEIIVRNRGNQPISHVRTWLTYDPTLLEGSSIDVHTNFPSVTPGESDFDSEDGYVMIEANNESETANAKDNVVIARVRFRVIGSSPTGTSIGFYDTQDNGHTTVTTTENGVDAFILSKLPGSLHVVFAVESAEESQSSANSISSEPEENQELLDEFGGLFDQLENTSDISVQEDVVLEPETTVEQAQNTVGQRTAFSLLQVRNLRLTTQGTSLFIGWDALNHPDLKAYNVYYGTTSGRYIQRKTVDRSVNSLVVRSLPFGTVYYVALRAVSTVDEESAFSREASVEIGNPLSSTAPLVTGTLDGGPNGRNPVGANLGNTGRVPGETGTASNMVLLLLVSAIIGTAIAVKRQTSLVSAHTVQ
jgi:hypothetical protein